MHVALLSSQRDNYPFGIISIYKKLCFGRAFCYVGAFIERPRAPMVAPTDNGGSICKNSAVLFTFVENYGIIQLVRKLELKR